MIAMMDAKNIDYYLLGDLNVDFMPTTVSPNKAKIIDILDIYGVDQLINEPTRITATSANLIDICFTNAPTNVVKSGVIHLSISDHSLIYLIRKIHHIRQGPRTIEIRSLKGFNRENFLRDLEQKPWENVYCSEDPNEMWQTWKGLLMEAINAHAPLRSRRVKNRKLPWITNEIRQQMYNRDHLKKRAISSNDPQTWHQFKLARNRINTNIKKAKRTHFTKKLDHK